MYSLLHYFSPNKFLKFRGNFPVHDPSTGDILLKLPRMSAEDVNLVAKMAMEAWSTWRLSTPRERSKFLQKIASLIQRDIDDLASIITLETGKPLSESRGEIAYGLSYFEFYAEETKRIHGDIIPSPGRGRKLLMTKHPIGPAALVTPWNFPFAMVARKVYS